MEVDQAIEIVAQQVVHNAVKWELDDGWANMPDIGENDWNRVAEKVLKLCPNQDDFNKAIEVLELRAWKSMENG